MLYPLNKLMLSLCFFFQAFLDTVLCEPLLANTWEVKRFLDPTTYSDEPYGEVFAYLTVFYWNNNRGCFA